MFDVLLALLLLTTATNSLAAATRYVWQDSPSPAPPYTNWTTAAHVIQDAVDAAQPGDTVRVAGGLYATGGRAVFGTMTNRVALDRAITVESLMGPEVTIIQGFQVPGTTNGDGAIRCVYLTNGASLSGFTLTNGATRGEGEAWDEGCGGGLWCESTNAEVSNCVVVNNSAAYAGGGAYGGTLNNCTLTGNLASSGDGGVYSQGGGAYRGTLNNCTLTGNSAESGGGVLGGILNNCTLTGNSAVEGGGAWAGTWEGTLNNCTLNGNSARYGGGVAYGTLNNCTLTANSAVVQGGGAYVGDWLDSVRLNNCIVYFNTAPDGPNFNGGDLNNCCTTPLPDYGAGNITNTPLFVDYATKNLRLQSNSPCINSGNNSSLTNCDQWGRSFTNLFDLDGLPRIVNGTVDIGAYEYQGPGSVISYAWLQHYALPTDGSADATDPDADGHNTRQEWRCLTDPTNALSVLRLLPASPDGTNVTVSWQSVESVDYFLERSTNLSAVPSFILLAPHLPGQPGITSFTDTNAAPLTPLFYRVGVIPGR